MWWQSLEMRATTAGNIVAEETEETEGGPSHSILPLPLLSLPEYEPQTQKYFLRRVRLRKENTELHRCFSFARIG